MSNIVFEWENKGNLEPGNLTHQEILSIADSAATLYRSINIGKGNKQRQIFIPDYDLEFIQRLVLLYYLKTDDVHPQVFSYMPGSSLIEHVEQHRDYLFTLKLDFSHFFESIKDSIVFKYFSERYPLELAEFLMKVTCRRGCLPIGAPSSPMLSNLILKRLDEHWHQQAENHQAVYTRYSDDIFISANSKELLLELIPRFEAYLKSFCPFLKLNHSKTAILGGNNRKITGLVITQDRDITIGRAKKRELRVLLDRYQKGLLGRDAVQSLRGKLLFLQGHDNEYFLKLHSRYEEQIIGIYSGFCESNTLEDSSATDTFAVDIPEVRHSLDDTTAITENSLVLGQNVGLPELKQLIQNYLDLGWQLLPCHQIKQNLCSCGKSDCKSPGKHPSVRHGVYDASADYRELLPWIQKGCNIGIATGFASKIVVLDIDIHKGGRESFQKLLKFIDPEMFNTLQCRTGSGGWHLYFRYPSITLKNRIGFLPGIDFKTDGGYVIAPPSNHVSGGRYSWVGDSPLSWNSIKALPECLIEFLKTDS